MKYLYTLVCTLFLATTINAQHVFDYSTAPNNPVGVDTVYGTVPATIPAIPDGQWYTWDLTNISLAGYQYYAEFSTASGFTNATHANKAYIEAAPTVKYETNLMFAIKNDGIKTYGERLDRQAYSLAAQTGNTADSLVIEKQDMMYSAPQIQMPFPCTMGTKWNATSNATMNLRITVTNLFLNNAPAERKTITISKNEVIGWGDLRIKRLDGKPSGTEQVLLVKNTISIQDSLFINGSPAPAALLAQAGITQGETRYVYQKSFYRGFEMLPMCNITYTDSNFATIKDVNMHSQRLNYPDNISEVSAGTMSIYPNPSNGVFTIKLPEVNDNNWSYTITDMSGKTVAQAAITNNNQEVNMSGKIPPGNYIINLVHDGKAIGGQKITIQ